MFNRAKAKSGFTLIELLVVLALISILAAVAVPNVINYIAKGEERAWTADQKTIQSAVDAYYSAPGNPRYQGKRQYPVFSQGTAGATTGLDVFEKGVNGAELLLATRTVQLKLSLLVPDYLKQAPASASVENVAGGTGSYTWYVGGDGIVSAFVYYDKATTGFKSGTYP